MLMSSGHPAALYPALAQVQPDLAAPADKLKSYVTFVTDTGAGKVLNHLINNFQGVNHEIQCRRH